MRLHISQTTLLFNEYLVINFSLRPSYRRIVELTAERCVRRDGDRPDVGCEVVADDAAKKHETVPDAVADDVSDSRVIGSRDRDVITLSRRVTRPIVIDFSSLASSAHRRALPSSNRRTSTVH